VSLFLLLLSLPVPVPRRADLVQPYDRGRGSGYYPAGRWSGGSSNMAHRQRAARTAPPKVLRERGREGDMVHVIGAREVAEGRPVSLSP
jgi:hypothetical protein